MTDKRNSSLVKIPSIDWSASTVEPEEIEVGVMRFNRDASLRAANMLISEANRYPDQVTIRTLKRPIDEVNEDVRAGLLLIGLELIAMSPLSITTETETSPDTDFHLITDESEPGIFTITLQVPVIVGEKGDKGDKGDTGDTGAQGIQGEPGEQGEQGEQGIQGEQGEQGEKGDKGDKGDTGDTGATGATGAQGEQGEQGEPGTGTTAPTENTPVDTIPSGDCVSFDIFLAANSATVLPVTLQPGYTIKIHDIEGAGSDGAADLNTPLVAADFSYWFCADGKHYSLGGCLGGTQETADVDDPMSTAYHMQLIISVNGVLYAVFDGLEIEVPSGAEDTLAIIQVNDSILIDNLGTYRFIVDICNPATSNGCNQVDDFIDGLSHGWTSAHGNFTFGTGFVNAFNGSYQECELYRSCDGGTLTDVFIHHVLENAVSLSVYIFNSSLTTVLATLYSNASYFGGDDTLHISGISFNFNAGQILLIDWTRAGAGGDYIRSIETVSS